MRDLRTNGDRAIRETDAARELQQPARNVTTTDAPTQALADRARDALRTGDVRADTRTDRQPVRTETSELLNRAGLERAGNGTTVIRDTASIGRTAEVEGLSNAQQVYGGTETGLRAAAPPRVQMTERMRAGAETLVASMDRAFNNALLERRANGDLRLRNTDELSADQLLAEFLKTNINDPNNSPETHQRMLEFATNMRQMSIAEAKKKIEVARELMKEAEKAAKEAEMIGTIVTIASIALTVCTFGAGAAVAGPAIAATQAGTQIAVQTATAAATTTAAAGASAAAGTAAAGTAAAGTTTATTAFSATAQASLNASVQGLGTQITNMGAQATTQGVNTAISTTAEAMTTTIMQSGSPAIQQSISQIGQKATEEMVKTQVTTQLNAFAAGQVQNTAVQAALQPGLTSQLGSALNVLRPNQALQVASVVTTAVGRTAQAAAEHKATDLMLDSKQAKNNAERFKLMADMHQRQIEEQNEAIKTIMESKNQTVDAVMQMLNASFASQQRLLSATMGRG